MRNYTLKKTQKVYAAVLYHYIPGQMGLISTLWQSRVLITAACQDHSDPFRTAHMQSGLCRKYDGRQEKLREKNVLNEMLHS